MSLFLTWRKTVWWLGSFFHEVGVVSFAKLHRLSSYGVNRHAIPSSPRPFQRLTATASLPPLCWNECWELHVRSLTDPPPAHCGSRPARSTLLLPPLATSDPLTVSSEAGLPPRQARFPCGQVPSPSRNRAPATGSPMTDPTSPPSPPRFCRHRRVQPPT